MKTLCLFLLSFVLVSLLPSCALMFNGKKQTVKLYTKEPITVETEKLTIKSTPHKDHYLTKLWLKRSKKDTTLLLKFDGVEKELFLMSELSRTSMLGIFRFTYIAMAIDYQFDKGRQYSPRMYIRNTPGGLIYDRYYFGDLHKDGRKNKFSFTPSKMIGTLNQGIEFGYERAITERFSVVANQLVYKRFIPCDCSQTGSRSHLELRRYFGKGDKDVRTYYGIEFGYTNKKWGNEFQFANAEFYENSMPGDTVRLLRVPQSYNEDIDVHLKQWSIAGKFGVTIPLNARLEIDLYAGIGVKFKDVAHFRRSDLEDNLWSRHPNIFHGEARRGRYRGLALPLNFRFAYRF